MKYVFLMLSYLVGMQAQAQKNIAAPQAKIWVDSVFKSLTKEEKIAQLMVVRLSEMDPNTRKVTFYTDKVSELINKYNIGGLCLFQGKAPEQAEILNNLQAKAKTPLLVCIDAEWGVGMRLIDDVLPLPKQMMLGAMSDQSIVYKYGRLVAEQCKRLGIQVNYAPVVDVNNNAKNPVINDRSFGEDKYKVANYGIAYMKGMQDNGVMATAKHFPGHGDVEVDSHYDLPVINKSMAQLDSLELYPFKKIFEAGIGAVMIAHLYIPAIDKTKNRASSLSPQNIKGLLRKDLGYQGLTFTDGLEMKGVQKYYPGAAASVQSIIAGNDMLCLPSDVPNTIEKIKVAIKAGKITWAEIDAHCRKVLESKYHYGLANLAPISIDNIVPDLNAGIEDLTREIADHAITLVNKTEDSLLPLSNGEEDKNRVLYVAVGTKEENVMTRLMASDLNAKVLFSANGEDASGILQTAEAYKKVVIGIHNMNRSPQKNFGLGSGELSLISKLQKLNSTTVVFGNPYALSNFCDAPNIIVCYEENDIIARSAIDMLKGNIPFQGVLPVTVCKSLPYGTGTITKNKVALLKKKP